MFAKMQESGQNIVLLVNTGAQKIPGTARLTHFIEAIFPNASRIKNRRK